MANPYQPQIDQLKAELMDGLTLAREFDPNYTESQFAQVLATECHKLNIRFNAIARAGGHPSDDLQIAIFAHKQLAEELGKEPLKL